MELDLELISFKLCPFVQRSVIMMLHKDVPHRITFIDLSDPPEWFHDLSPTGAVPVMKVNGDTVLFESAVIAEFIDEATPGNVQPTDPLLRAKNRAWTEFGSAAFGDMFQLTGANDEQSYKKARQSLIEKLDWFEEIIEGPYFNGEEPALVDFAVAPLFMRLELLNEKCRVYERDDYPKVSTWSDHLLAMPSVQNSVVPEFAQMYRNSIKMRGAYAKTLFCE